MGRELGSMHVLLDAKDVVTGSLNVALFVRYYLAHTNDGGRCIFLTKKGESEMNFHMAGVLERDVRYSSAFCTCGF
jgi:hypothetical protein